MSTTRSSAATHLRRPSTVRTVSRTPVVSTAEANEALRTYVRARAGRPWTRAELAELDRLRRVWREAVRAESTAAFVRGPAESSAAGPALTVAC